MKNKLEESKKLWIELYTKWANENDDISKWLVIGLLGILQMIPTMLFLKALKYSDLHDPKFESMWLNLLGWTFGVAAAFSAISLFIAWTESEWKWHRRNGHFAKSLLEFQIPALGFGAALPAAVVLVVKVCIIVFGGIFNFLWWLA